MKRFFLSILLFFSCLPLFATTWFVPDSLSNIQSAIDIAMSGDTVLVSGAYQNMGAIVIADKQIALLSKNYINNPGSYSIQSGTALFDTDNSDPLLTIRNADSTMVMGFLLDKSDAGSGGGIIIENSDAVLLQALHFNNNTLSISNSSVLEINTEHYYLNSENSLLITLNASTLNLINSTWKYNQALSLLHLDNNSEFYAENLATYTNNCESYLYDIHSSHAYFYFFTSYKNQSQAQDWNFTHSHININSSILQNNPPLDNSQCNISYTALPGPFPGDGNLFERPLVDTLGAVPILLPESPCISRADPDTNAIMRTDLLGNIRPNPEWAPPDMGAFESERYMMANEATRFWISPLGHDTWGNGSLEYPFASLQKAVDYAEEFDTLIFKPGTYYGQASIYDKPLVISSEYILNADPSYRDSVLLIPDSTIYTPIISASFLDSIKISALSFKNGSGHFIYNNYTLGGALYLQNVKKVTLDHLLFEKNHAEHSGGAFFALNSYLEMDHIDFIQNSAYLGGALSLSASIANVSHLNFYQNTSSSGGALYANNVSKFTSFYTSFSKNNASSSALKDLLAKKTAVSEYGGAIFASNSEIKLYNNLFNANYAKNKGAAIAIRGGKFNLLQSTLANHDHETGDMASIYLKDKSFPALIVNSILWNENIQEIELVNSKVSLNNSCLFNSINGILLDSSSSSSMSNVFSQDPLFDVDLGLQATSPYCNSGLKSFNDGSYYLLNYAEDEYDDSAPGLGYQGARPSIDFTPEKFIPSAIQTPDTYNILSAYPNPFNPSTFLEFTLSHDANTRLDLYDIRGRHIKTLIEDHLYSGTYTFLLNAADLGSGVYICRLSQNGLTLDNQKILLVK
ncbi:MAG: T9SS type A sorting domain-containing protein [Candidatus Neomarinimicrobiota bacterium]